MEQILMVMFTVTLALGAIGTVMIVAFVALRMRKLAQHRRWQRWKATDWDNPGPTETLSDYVPEYARARRSK